MQKAARQGTTQGMNVPLDPKKVPNAAEFSILANAIEEFAPPPPPPSILPTSICTVGCYLSPP